MLFTPTLPPIPHLTGRCQRLTLIGKHSLLQRLTGRIGQGSGIKTRVRRLRHARPPAPRRDPLGASSRFADGTWVRVRDEASVRRTLDGQSRLRGLMFTPAQWETCSRVYRVVKSVRRIIDDKGRLRPVSRTVLLGGVDCGGESDTAGCGRHCPTWYRDEWLEASEPPAETPGACEQHLRIARVGPMEHILKRLGLLDRRDGLMFMPEMARYVGTRVGIVRQLSRVFEYDRWTEPPCPVYILEGLHCTGAILGSDGPCDRTCPLLWHADWLELDA